MKLTALAALLLVSGPLRAAESKKFRAVNGKVSAPAGSSAASAAPAKAQDAPAAAQGAVSGPRGSSLATGIKPGAFQSGLQGFRVGSGGGKRSKTTVSKPAGAAMGSSAGASPLDASAVFKSSHSAGGGAAKPALGSPSADTAPGGPKPGTGSKPGSGTTDPPTPGPLPASSFDAN